MTPWTWLAIAAVCEIAWAVGLKYSNGMTRLAVTIPTVILMLASFYCLAQAVKQLPLGTAYGMWTGVGAAGTAILGIILFNEPKSAMRLGFLGGLIVCLIGLKLSS